MDWIVHHGILIMPVNLCDKVTIKHITVQGGSENVLHSLFVFANETNSDALVLSP